MDRAQRSLPGGGAAEPAEVVRFDALAAGWWDPHGPMRALHAMNPLRTGWVDARLPGPGTLLDVGCGAGLAAEAFARPGPPASPVSTPPAGLSRPPAPTPPGCRWTTG